MQSSAAVAGRALIMLACVIGIPALAMSGTSWSEILKRLQDLRWPAILDPASASTSVPADETRRLASSSLSTAPAAGHDSTGFLQQTPPRELSPVPAVAPWLQGQPAEPVSSGVIPVGYQMPADSCASALPPGADPFHSIQERLRELGATYYLLESWGNQQQMYRFYCRMAIGGNASYTHYFEAMEPDPLQAMHQVLRQVERWRQRGTLTADNGR